MAFVVCKITSLISTHGIYLCHMISTIYLFIYFIMMKVVNPTKIIMWKYKITTYSTDIVRGVQYKFK